MLNNVSNVSNSSTVSNASNAIAIGNTANVTSGANNSIAIGFDAQTGAFSAIQLGDGTNNNASTLQFLTTQLANATGLVTGHTAVNYTAADSNIDTHLSGIDTELANKQDALPQPSTVNRETIVANLTLTNDAAIYQHITASFAGLQVNLPASPVNGTHFLIKNNASGSEDFVVNLVNLNPGNIYEVIYDGTEWVVL